MYYNTLLALALFPAGYLLSSEGGAGGRGGTQAILESLMNAQALLPLFISCVFGLGISYFAMSCRKALSATTFTGTSLLCVRRRAGRCRPTRGEEGLTCPCVPSTPAVLGVICKIGTIVINATVWSHHASPAGIFFLTLCVAGGVLYQQSLPSGAAPKAAEPPKVGAPRPAA